MFQHMIYQTKAPYKTKSWDLYTDQLSYTFLDIETTGLSSKHNAVILSGLAAQKGDELYITQYFAQNPTEERDVLAQTLLYLETHPIWITYNGNSFDLPFLEKRMNVLGIADKLPLHQSFDLYRIIKRFSPLAGSLPDLKQKTVEGFLGLADSRKDHISGKESVALYEQYAMQPSAALRETILLHNSDDVAQMSGLLQILNKLDLHRIMSNVGFWIQHEGKKLLITQIRPEKRGVTIRGKGTALMDYASYDAACEVSYDSRNGEFFMFLPCLREQAYSFFDLEAFSLDLTELCQYPAFESGFLLYQQENEFLYRELNHLIRLLVTDILKNV